MPDKGGVADTVSRIIEQQPTGDHRPYARNDANGNGAGQCAQRSPRNGAARGAAGGFLFDVVASRGGFADVALGCDNADLIVTKALVPKFVQRPFRLATGV